MNSFDCGTCERLYSIQSQVKRIEQEFEESDNHERVKWHDFQNSWNEGNN